MPSAQEGRALGWERRGLPHQDMVDTRNRKRSGRLRHPGAPGTRHRVLARLTGWTEHPHGAQKDVAIIIVSFVS